MRPEPADGLPAVGLVPGHDNLYVAAMHSGITLAPLIGRLAALEIVDGIVTEQLSAFRPARFC